MNQDNEAKWRIEYSKYSTYCNIIDADGYVGTIQGREKAELIAKAPEMAAEIERLKDRINTYLDAVHSIAHKRIDLQDVVDAIRGVSNQTEEIDRQAAELSKLRQENEAKRSDLTDKLEEAVRHMDNGHTAQATTLIYEVIGELEPKGE